MAPSRVAVERRIPVPPGVLYGIIRDYRTHRPRILPPGMRNLTVEQGGVGAGTIFTIDVKAGPGSGRRRVEVAEPQPGHRLEERDLDSSLVTAYSVLAMPDGAIVRIEVTGEGGRGIGGLLQRVFAPGALRKLYQEELDRLAEYAATNPPGRSQ